MTPTLRFELPYPPSVNNYWHASGKRRYISPAGKKFTDEVLLVVKQSGTKSFGDKSLGISVMIHPRSKRKFDLDNTLKAILDALMKANVYDDDSQFEYIEIARGEPRDGGAAVVHIYEIEKEEHNG